MNHKGGSDMADIKDSRLILIRESLFLIHYDGFKRYSVKSVRPLIIAI